MDHSKVAEFWKTIFPVLERVLTDHENDQLIMQLDSIVSAYCDFDWEYGPSEKTDFYFCLSPNLREELIDEIDDVISRAPNLIGWEFICGKPRKPGVVNWVMLNEREEEITIDAHSWRCVVYKFPDNTVDLDIKLTGVNGNLDTQCIAVDILLTNILGERSFIKVVKGVNIVSEFEERNAEKSIVIEDLFKVIDGHILRSGQ
jgi:hypothetical protein